jgi:hypothetical protein
MDQHTLCDGDDMATIRFCHLGQHFMTPGEFEDSSISKILHFVQGVGLLKA